MNINLNQAEIVDALIMYVNNQGFNTEGKSVAVTVTAGRGANGNSASVAISTVSYENDGEHADPESGDAEDQKELF